MCLTQVLFVSADVDGSLEAILDTLESYRSEQCRLNIIHYGVGGVSQHDIELAQMFNGKYILLALIINYFLGCSNF